MAAVGDVARMLTLVPWLLERPGASVAETAEAFGVSEATIRRDLGHLDFCGLPGLGGGDLFEVDLVGDRVVVQMADELRRPLRPTPREALRLVLTLDAVTEALAEELPALRTAVDKVRGALGIPETVADVVDPGASALVPRLRRAIAAERQVRVRYQGRADDVPQWRTVDPWALQVVDGIWYLRGHDADVGAPRTFRLDRVAELEPTDEPRRQPAPEQLPPPAYAPGPDDLEVVIELAPGGRWVIDALTVDELEEQPDGTVRVRLRTDAPGWLARVVLTAGGAARVVAPEELRRRVRDLATRALHRYATDAPAD
ncbi:helix-turn-helix transcriptional regulator [Egicoccus halophilus]|uniref:Protein pafC n=1 Tax=Egicoccus halophilus TaxID=1670830 RepID=A0A8J3ADG9_9ACTN|nr:WYL domain-containing protein [Egicoccus halophilus]GGI04687.1 protein pafC [Egicoccus halophilus]